MTQGRHPDGNQGQNHDSQNHFREMPFDKRDIPEPMSSQQ